MTSAINPGSSKRNPASTAAACRLSVVVVNWNVRELLRDCLASLDAAGVRELGEVIVVDNASSDHSADLVRSEFPWVRLIESGGNIGYSCGNNLGLQAPEGDWLFLLNPDTVVRPESLRALVRFAEAHPRLGACAPLQLDRDGRIQTEAAVDFPTIWNVLCDFLLLSVIFPRSPWFNGRKLGPWDHTGDRQVPAISGAAMLVRRELWHRLGGLDETMFCLEDMDYCRRIRAAGFEIWYAGSVSIVHYGRSSISQHSQGWQRQVMVQSFWLYYRKHFGPAAATRMTITMFLWSIFTLALLWLPARLLPTSSRIGRRFREVRDMAGALLAWSLCDKLAFRHPLAKPLAEASA